MPGHAPQMPVVWQPHCQHLHSLCWRQGPGLLRLLYAAHAGEPCLVLLRLLEQRSVAAGSDGRMQGGPWGVDKLC
jgi:hypothetical protein